MGLFSKLKQNFTHGGVDVKLQAPASVSMQDASVPVTVSVSASDSPQTIKAVRVEIIREDNNQSFNQNGVDNQSSNRETVARAENVEMFTLSAGESRSVQLSIVMNAGKSVAEQLPQGSGLAAVAGVFEKLQQVSEAMNQNSYRYEINASADVDGIALDPSDSHPIQILKPGEMGTAINIGS